MRKFFSNIAYLVMTALPVMTVFACPSMAAAPSFRFTVALDEAVTVDTTNGTPSIPVDVGGQTRSAVYTSGSGSTSLTFTYTATPGDLDLDGITVSSPLVKNGGTITDLAGNPIADADLAFTSPTTTGVRINYPSLSMDFINDRYSYNGTVYNSFNAFKTGSNATFTNDTNGTYFDSVGTMHKTSVSNTPRMDYDPVTHTARGILIEDNRINYIRNSTMVGAGTGVLPTNWYIQNVAGVTSTVVGTGVENGINYLDVRFSGTPTTSNAAAIFFDTSNSTATTNGQMWANSAYVKLAGGSFTNIASTSFSSQIFDSSNIYISGSGGINLSSPVPSSAALSSQRYSYTTTIANSSASYIRTFVAIYVTSGNPVDVTLRIGAPQLERSSSSSSSFIPTSGATVSRASDSFTIPISGGWYNADEGTLFVNMQSSGTNGGRFATLTFQNTSTNKSLGISNGANTTASVADTGYATQAIFTKTLTSPTTVALGYKANDFGASFDGAAALTDNAGTVPTGFSELRLGWNQVPSQGATAYLSKVRYYPLRATNTQLQLLTQ